MKFSDIKGKGSLAIIADILELVDGLKDSDDVRAFTEAMADGEPPLTSFYKLAPVLRDEKTQDAVVSIISRAKKYDPDDFAENGDVLGEIWEFLNDDIEALDFFAKPLAAAPTGSPSENTQGQNRE